jgi:lipopolysaccharide export system permease protein
MMFFIGAPLGAIIRKGGLFAYYICSSNLYFFSLHQHFRKEIAQENGMSPFMGRGCRHLSCHH